MKMFEKFKLKPGIVIAILGFCGLTFSLIDKSGGIGGKIPATVFFLIVMVIGMGLEMIPKDQKEGFYGEVRGGREFV